jgi:hypothetical protein
MRDLLHDREGFCNHALGRRIFVRHFKQLQCQTEAFPIPRLGDVTALFEAQQHPKDFGYSTMQATSDLAFREARGVVGKEFQDVQALFQGRGRITKRNLSRLRGYWLGTREIRLGQSNKLQFSRQWR